MLDSFMAMPLKQFEKAWINGQKKHFGLINKLSS